LLGFSLCTSITAPALRKIDARRRRFREGEGGAERRAASMVHGIWALPDIYKRTFRKAAQTREFTIHTTDDCGWEVREEQNSHVITCIRTRDWHRVERAYHLFALQAAALSSGGWSES
jgi:hypothetical protein